MGMIKLKNIELKDVFSSMTSSQLKDSRFLAKFIFEKVGISLNPNSIKMNTDDISSLGCWGGLMCKQYPDEIAQLLVFLYQHKDEINSFCEIGSERGGTFFLIDSFLRVINKNMKESVTIDISSKILNSGFEEYKNQNPLVSFLNISSRDFKPEQRYDFCFIDGSHKYEDCKDDFEKMKQYSSIIAFHDINFYKKLRDLWDSLERHKIEFSNRDPLFLTPVGIGVIYGI